MDEYSWMLDQEWQNIRERMYSCMHPNPRFFFAQTGGQFHAISDGEPFVLTGGRPSKKDLTLLISDGEVEYASDQGLVVRDATFWVLAALTLLDECLFFGPMFYQIGIRNKPNWELLDELVSCIASANRKDRSALAAREMLVEILATAAEIEVSKERLSSPFFAPGERGSFEFNERLFSAFEKYRETLRNESSDDTAAFADHLSQLTPSEISDLFCNCSSLGVSDFVSLEILDRKLGECEPHIEADAFIKNFLLL